MSFTTHKGLLRFVDSMQSLCNPAKVHVCEGSEKEYDSLCHGLVESGAFIRLNPTLRPNSYLCRSDPRDVARIEQRTFICSETHEEAGPTNNWKDPAIMQNELQGLFSGCMEGRTMYVVVFSMGPLESPYSIIGVQVTDSPYVVVNMKIMTRMGKSALAKLEASGEFVPCVHSVGMPLSSGKQDVSWPCNPEKTVIAHFPKSREIWSYGSGYGGNALLGKKCLALRIASVMARDEGWLAEHMLISKMTNPEGKSRYFAAAFPSACGKTNLAMLTPSLEGWSVETVGDDIAWIHVDTEGTLRAINPEAGFFGVAPGTSNDSNPHAMEAISKNTIFTNVALTDEGDVWWEGMTEKAPSHLVDWKGNDWTPTSKEPAAHPNARFTAPIQQCPSIDPAFDSAEGVPLSAIIFGGRRNSVIPLVYKALDWNHGVFIGASLSSEMTAAAAGKIGKLRHDPFAMLPFCGYNMGDYFQHWIDIGKKGKNLPQIFQVNWFRKDEDGNYIWPGYGENIRILAWIFACIEEKSTGVSTPEGVFPRLEEIPLEGLFLQEEAVSSILLPEREQWITHLREVKEYFTLFGKHLPKELQR